MRVWIRELQNRQIIKEHQCCPENRTQTNKYSKNQRYSQKSKPPFIDEIQYRQNRGVEKPLKKSAKGLCPFKVSGRGPIGIEYFCNPGVKHKPPHAQAQEHKRQFLKLS